MLMGKQGNLLKELLNVLPVAVANILRCMHTASQFIPATLTRMSSLTEHIG